MADYVETSGIQGGNTRSDLTIVHTTAAGFSDGVLAIAVYFGDTTAAISSVTVNDSATGVGLVVAVEDNPNPAHDAALYRFVGAQPETEYTVEITLEAPAEMWGEVIVLEDVDQTAPVRDAAAGAVDGSTGSNGIAGATVDSDVGDLVLGLVTLNSSSTEMARVNSQTPIASDSSSDYKESAYLPGTSPTVTMGWQQPALNTYSAAVVASFQSPQGAGDETAPTLSSATATATGQTTADLSVTTDEEADVYVVVTTSSTTPTAEQIEAGQDHTGAAAAFSDSAPGASAGAVPFSATGLAAGTQYWAHFWAEDAAENSATPVTSSSFTTDAVPTLTAEGADLEMEGGAITLTHVTQGTIASTVTLGGQPVEGATVRLYNQTDDTYEGDTTTDGSGAYAFEGLALAKKYHAFVEYEADGVLYHAPSQPGLRPVAD